MYGSIKLNLTNSIFQSIVIFFICGCANKTNIDEGANAPISMIKPVSNKGHVDNFYKVDYKVVRRDTALNERVFIVINPIEVEERKILSKIICQVIKFDSLSQTGRISFFTKEEFANYKDEIFINDSIFCAEYDNWLNEYYYGEFDLETRKFIKFPASPNLDKRMEYFLFPCCE